jgi:hypothetical protein
MSQIRYFTSLLLRPDEEVDASVVPWLSRWATVEFDGDEPVTAVWQTSHGDRRVCWYGDGNAADYVKAHAQRHGQEPFWIVSREADAEGELGASVQECDQRFELVARRTWRFDAKGIPLSEEEFTPDGTLTASRTYAGAGRTADFVRERRPPSSAETRPFLPQPPVPELSAETFPAGGTMSSGLIRVLGPILENEMQGRYRSICRCDGRWQPAITTMAFVRTEAIEQVSPMLDFQVDGIAPLVARGDLHHPRWPEWEMPFWAITELVPDGATVEEIVESGPLEPAAAVGLALRLGEVARLAHDRGHDLGGGIRPELVYLRSAATGFQLSAVLHRGPALLHATRRGEAILIPPAAFPSDFSHADDVTGLAQLLWYMVTGGHPFLAPEDVRWEASWTSFRHENRERQLWRGPPALGPLLERALFEEGGGRPSLAEFLAELGHAHGQLDRRGESPRGA